MLFPFLIFILEITVLIRNSPERFRAPLSLRDLEESFSRKRGPRSEREDSDVFLCKGREGKDKGKEGGREGWQLHDVSRVNGDVNPR